MRNLQYHTDHPSDLCDLCVPVCFHSVFTHSFTHVAQSSLHHVAIKAVVLRPIGMSPSVMTMRSTHLRWHGPWNNTGRCLHVCRRIGLQGSRGNDV